MLFPTTTRREREVGTEKTSPEPRCTGGRSLAGSGIVFLMGKKDPASSLAVFPVSEVPAPTRRRQRSPEGECRAVGELKSESALKIGFARIVGEWGRPKAQVHFFQQLALPLVL